MDHTGDQDAVLVRNYALESIGELQNIAVLENIGVIEQIVVIENIVGLGST